MKKLLLLLHFAFYMLHSQAQNVGINNLSPAEKLTINGNLLVSQPVTKSKGLPNAAHTFTLVANIFDTVQFITDSVYRIYDPGGAANYPPNTQAAVRLLDSSGFAANQVAGGAEITFDSINLASGDSVYIIGKLTNSVIMRAGSNFNGTHPSYSGNNIVLYFISAPGSPTAPGFSAIVRRLYVSKNDAGAGGTGVAGDASLFFNSLTGALRAGVSNDNQLGNAAFVLGSNCRASGAASGALGNNSVAYGSGDMALAGGSASGNFSVAMGSNCNATGSTSMALGYGSRTDGITSTAIGGGYSIGTSSMAMGIDSRSYGTYSTALAGGYTDPAATAAVAIGSLAKANKDYSVALGKSANASGTGALAAGMQCTASGDFAAAIGYNSYASGYASVAMGSSGASGGYATSIGQNCTASGQSSFAAGTSCGAGAGNCVSIGYFAGSSANGAIAIGNSVDASGVRSTAMGNYVSTNGYEGAFTIGDHSSTTVMQTFVANGFRTRFAGGYRLFTNSAATVGAFLNAGANSWAALSDRRMKENFLPVDGEAFLQKIAAMPLTTWNYIGQEVKTFRHYGPMAQDFFAAFGKDKLGEIGCDTLINQQDFLGVNLIAIQALEKRTAELNEKLIMQNARLVDGQAKLEAENAAMKSTLAEMQAQVKELQRNLQPSTTQK